MPTYDYKCKSCSHTFEQFQSMKDSSLRKCPVCGKNTLKRLIGIGAAVLFKGSGFYQTDYRSDSYKAGQKAESPAKDGGGEGGKSDSTGEAKKEPAAAESSAKPTEKAKPVETKSKPATKKKDK